MARVKDHIAYSPHDTEGRADVFQMSAAVGGLSLALRIAEDTPSELMRADHGTDITMLRRKFQGFPFIDAETTNQEIGEWVGAAITAALDNRR
jgi:hypothetical protein